MKGSREATGADLAGAQTAEVPEQGCGTYGAYQQHRKRGESCDECRRAATAYMRNYRKQHPEALSKDKALAKLRQQAAAEIVRRHHREYMRVLIGLKKDAAK